MSVKITTLLLVRYQEGGFVLKCYLLDLENLPYAMKWAYHQEYSKEDRVYVLYSEELYSYYLQNIASMNKKCKFVKGFKITSKSKNALDFNLAGIFGMLYSEELYSYYLQNIASMNKKCKFVKGFKITSKSKNALDFNLAGIFGMLIQECVQQRVDTLEVHIVSEDSGYRSLGDLASWARLNFGLNVKILFESYNNVAEISKKNNKQKQNEPRVDRKLKELYGFKFYNLVIYKDVIYSHILSNESEDTKFRVERVLAGAYDCSANTVMVCLQRYFSNKEAKRIYDKLKYFLENNTLGDVREIQNVLEKGGN